MCKEATIITRVDIDNKKLEVEKIIDESKPIPIDEQSKMLCNVIVRATHELHVKQQKSKSEIEIFLKNDCQQLKTSQLVEKVRIKNIFKRKKTLNLSFFFSVKI
jgi:hypothetical protein